MLRTDINGLAQQASCHAEHQFGEAVEGYTKAILISPTNAVYYANRAAAHIHLENFGCALADASKAIELDPKYTKVHLSCICLHFHDACQNHMQAIHYLQIACPIIALALAAKIYLLNCSECIHALRAG